MPNIANADGVEELPDLIPAYKAAALLACSWMTLKRLAKRGLLRQYRHPERSGYFYALEDVRRERARFVAVLATGGASD